MLTTEIKTNYDRENDFTRCEVKVFQGKEIRLSQTFTLLGHVTDEYDIAFTAMGLKSMGLVI